MNSASWGIVTAWNPGGVPRERKENDAAQRALLNLISGRPHLNVVNGDGVWAEPAALLLGTPLSVLTRLGRQVGQAAVLFGVGRRAALVWLEAGGVVIERFWAQPV